MKQRTKSEWCILIKEQAESLLSVEEFCKQHHIGQTYFYKRRSELQPGNASKPKSGFIKVNKPASTNLSTASIKLQFQQTRLSFPASISPNWSSLERHSTYSQSLTKTTDLNSSLYQFSDIEISLFSYQNEIPICSRKTLYGCRQTEPGG